jgi:hypothetical protein
MIFPRKCALGLILLLAITAGSASQAQTGEGAIYGVTNLNVAPGATNQAIAVLKQYRDAALKQAGELLRWTRTGPRGLSVLMGILRIDHCG